MILSTEDSPLESEVVFIDIIFLSLHNIIISGNV